MKELRKCVPTLAQYADVAAFLSSGAERLNEAEWTTACATIQSIDIMGGRDRFANREREREREEKRRDEMRSDEMRRKEASRDETRRESVFHID